MRPVTRNTLLGIVAVVVVLLALGALPSYLGTGEPVYLVATPEDGTYSVENGTAVNASQLSAQRYPYTTAALENATPNDSGRSDPYRSGPIGLKGAFAHSPFDELDALRQQYEAAADDDSVVVRHDGTFYRLAVTETV